MRLIARLLWCGYGSGCLFASGPPAALLRVGFAHVDSCRVAHDPVRARVLMDPAVESRVPIPLLVLDAEDVRGGGFASKGA